MVTLEVKYLNNVQKLAGLLVADSARPVYFKTHFGIHTLGLKFPIDVLILDRQSRVVKIAYNLKPNSIFLWPLKYNQVIELPSGAISKDNIEIGTLVKLKII